MIFLPLQCLIKKVLLTTWITEWNGLTQITQENPRLTISLQRKTSRLTVSLKLVTTSAVIITATAIYYHAILK